MDSMDSMRKEKCRELLAQRNGIYSLEPDEIDVLAAIMSRIDEPHYIVTKIAPRLVDAYKTGKIHHLSKELKLEP